MPVSLYAIAGFQVTAMVKDKMKSRSLYRLIISINWVSFVRRTNRRFVLQPRNVFRLNRSRWLLFLFYPQAWYFWERRRFVIFSRWNQRCRFRWGASPANPSFCRKFKSRSDRKTVCRFQLRGRETPNDASVSLTFTKTRLQFLYHKYRGNKVIYYWL